MTDNHKKLENLNWYSEDIKEIFKFFNSSQKGLDAKNLKLNQKNFSNNVLETKSKRGFLDLVSAQLNSPLVYILIFAAGAILLLGKFIDAAVIIVIVILNTVIGAVQEGKAENTLEALKKVVKGYAVVVRDGNEIVIEDSEVVPGDIISLKDGSIVPADARLIEVNNLRVNQSALTGESEAVVKNTDINDELNISFNEQNNMLFKGTHVISGLAKAIVVRTGTETVIGQISKKLVEIDTEIPLKLKIKKLSYSILKIVTVASVLIFIVDFLRGENLIDTAMVVVALAVAVIPESLPVIVTLVLASGVWRMSQKNVLVKRLQAVEALGQADVIALDKTGTITKNQMTVGKIFVNNRLIDVKGEGYNDLGKFYENGKEIQILKTTGDQIINDEDLDLVGKISTFTSIAEFNKDISDNWMLEQGDPTEAALNVLGIKLGMHKIDLENKFQKLQEIPFNMKTKFHATINQIGNKRVLSLAGGPEEVTARCNSIWENGQRRKIDKSTLKKLESVINELSKDGYRILALAADLNSPKEVEENSIEGLTFIGFTGISDAIRPEVYDAVKKAKDAHMKVVMITGDHAKTAEAIARKVGIFHSGDKALTGKEMRFLNDDALANLLQNVTVFARVSPDDKLRIIKAFQTNGDIVAMTGDGINDALSLVAADLGVAMGQNGTEVAREAADIVLVDDNFGNIISAAEEGRHIFWTIRKVVSHLLSTNMGELFTILVASLIGLPLPLLATQIIWLNMVTDTFLVSAISVDPKEKDIMDNVYRRPGNSLIDKITITRIIIVSSIMAAVTLYLFNGSIYNGQMEKAWTISLTMLTVFQALNIFNVKSHFKTIFSRDTFNNKYLILGVFVALGLHMFAIYNPFMQRILSTTGLSIKEWGAIIPFALLVVVAEEIRKFIYRNYFMKLKVAL